MSILVSLPPAAEKTSTTRAERSLTAYLLRRTHFFPYSSAEKKSATPQQDWLQCYKRNTAPPIVATVPTMVGIAFMMVGEVPCSALAASNIAATASNFAVAARTIAAAARTIAATARTIAAAARTIAAAARTIAATASNIALAASIMVVLF